MTVSNFTIHIHDIRNAIKHTHRDVLTNKPVNTASIRDMVDTLTQTIQQQAANIDATMRDTLASDLTVLVGELDSLEKFIEQHMKEESH